MKNWRAWFAFELSLFGYDPTEWIVLTGDRLLVALLQFVVLLGIFGAVVASRYVPLVADTPILFLLFALIAANFTLIAIVTSLSQLVIGRRLESPGEIRSKLDDTIAYRQDVGETIGETIVPIKPDAFFLTLFENARKNSSLIRDHISEGRTRRTREELEDLVVGLEIHIDHVVGLLEHPASGVKHALFAALNTDYEHHVHRAWYLQSEYANELTPRVADPLHRLTETLEHIVVASRMFDATFIEAELSELSRYLLYVGIPVQIGAVLVTLLYTAPDATPIIPASTLRLVIPAILAAGFAPFLILSSYIVRLTVVARRTAENFPFSSHLRTTLELSDTVGEER